MIEFLVDVIVSMSALLLLIIVWASVSICQIAKEIEAEFGRTDVNYATWLKGDEPCG